MQGPGVRLVGKPGGVGCPGLEQATYSGGL